MILVDRRYHVELQPRDQGLQGKLFDVDTANSYVDPHLSQSAHDIIQRVVLGGSAAQWSVPLLLFS